MNRTGYTEHLDLKICHDKIDVKKKKKYLKIATLRHQPNTLY